jgi:hypothetical protein
MTRQRYGVGDWFAVPLRDGGFGVGLIARMEPQGAVLLGYFFGPRRSALPDLGEVAKYRASDAVMVRRFGGLDLRRGAWPIIGRLPGWESHEWPMPVFGRQVEFEGVAWRVEYRDDDPNATPRETRISVDECKRLPPNGVFGSGLVEILMTMALTAPADC